MDDFPLESYSHMVTKPERVPPPASAVVSLLQGPTYDWVGQNGPLHVGRGEGGREDMCVNGRADGKTNVDIDTFLPRVWAGKSEDEFGSGDKGGRKTEGGEKMKIKSDVPRNREANASTLKLRYRKQLLEQTCTQTCTNLHTLPPGRRSYSLSSQDTFSIDSFDF